ncbi:MAG: sigma-70 family RNA polymerase sigma factor [Polyangiaceae bacterium]
MRREESAALRAYRGSMANVARVSKDAETELATRWRGGEKDAGVKLVTACLPFVVSIAIEYRRWGIPLEDIVQQGNLGLLRAAAKFDPKRECRLATYAGYWIRAEIRDYVIRGYRVVRLGTTKAERRALRAYRTTRESDPLALAAASGLSPERAEMLLPLLAYRESSLDTHPDDHKAVRDRLETSLPTPEAEISAREIRGRASAAVHEALRDLSERERIIVHERWMTDEPQTLQELGDRLGVSKERVRQIEERARAKLRVLLGDMEGEAA